ncbi:MAG: non-hydrolyzing UDP-N-acetylglucosamine 2-epimerase [Faecousia sp.]
MSVFGTRPEAIKMCPLITRLQRMQEVDSVVCVTAQHRYLLDQVLTLFGIVPDYDLNLMHMEQSLTDITTGILKGMEDIYAKECPDLVLVHGDTTTSFAAALAAFYRQIPIGHVEAGLRTYHRYSPFPEEMNRQMVDRLAQLHFAVTPGNRDNLLREGITRNVFVTGNTGIDALQQTVKSDYRFREERLNAIDFQRERIILLTAHRRENLGQPLREICAAVRRLAETHRDTRFVFPVHPNPVVREVVYPLLTGQPGIFLTEPLDVGDLHNLLSRSYLVMTDSGGLQEEAAALGIPLVVLRAETERNELLRAGGAVLGGRTEQEIFAATAELLEDGEKYQQMQRVENPFGDGQASDRIAAEILSWASAPERNL